jgi:cation transporter-like permease
MSTRTGRIALIVVGVIAIVVGGVFAGQGLNLIPGSSMTGDRKWLYIGLVILIVGVILVMVGARRSTNGSGRR